MHILACFVFHESLPHLPTCIYIYILYIYFYIDVYTYIYIYSSIYIYTNRERERERERENLFHHMFLLSMTSFFFVKQVTAGVVWATRAVRTWDEKERRLGRYAKPLYPP